MSKPATRAEEKPANQSRANKAIRMKARGATNSEISDELDIPEQSVKSLLNSPLAQERLQKLERKLEEQQKESFDEDDGVNAILKSAAPKAAETLLELLSSESAPQRRQAALEILDRTGYGKKDKHEVEHTIKLPPKQAQALATTAETVEAEYELKGKEERLPSPTDPEEAPEEGQREEE